jgi:hypothetical protein
VTALIQRMREELVRRNYAETTMRSYLQTMKIFEGMWASVWTNLAHTTSGGTKSIY